MSRSEHAFDLDVLLLRSRKGDGRAWSELVERFKGHVYSAARRAGLGEDDAADVFQTTFIALHRSLDRIESGRALPNWLATTAGREALRIRRGKRREVPEWDGAEMSLDELVATEDAEVHDLAVAAVESHRVREALQDLGKPCRDLLEALYEESEPSYQEISARLGMPMGSIGPRRARCLDRLRKILASMGFFSS